MYRWQGISRVLPRSIITWSPHLPWYRWMTRDLHGGRRIPVIVLWIYFYFDHLWFLLTIGADDIQRLAGNVRIWLTGQIASEADTRIFFTSESGTLALRNVATVWGTNLFELYSPVVVSWWYYEGVSFPAIQADTVQSTYSQHPSTIVSHSQPGVNLCTFSR